MIILTGPSSVYSQTESPKSIELQLDFARYEAGDKRTLTEIYYSFPRNNLSHVWKNGEYTAEYTVQLNVSSKDSLIQKFEWGGQDKVLAMADINGDQKISDLYSLVLTEAYYLLEVIVTDLNSGSAGKKSVELNGLKILNNELFMSDIQLALDIKKTEEKNRYVKNGYIITPNPSGVYNPKWPILFYYLEVYNLSPLEPGLDSTYSIKATIQDSNR